MDWRDALRFPLADEKWFRKILFPALALFLPVAGPLVLAGWGLEISRRVIRVDPEALPPLRFRQNIRDGAAVWMIALVSTLPALFWLAIGSLLSVRIFPGDIESNRAWFDAFWWGAEFVALALFLAGGMFTAAAVGRFAQSGSLRSAFELPALFRLIRGRPAAMFLAAAAALPLALFALAGMPVCCAGACFTAAYAAAVGFHWTGRAYLAAAGGSTDDAETAPRGLRK